MTTAKALLGSLRVRVRAPRLTKPGQPRARDEGHGECTGMASPHGLPDPASRPGGDLEPVGAGSSQQGTAFWNVNCAVGLFAQSSRAHCITFTGLPTSRAVVGCSPSFAAAHRVLHPSVCSCPSADLPACCVSADFPHLTACRLCVCRGVHPWKCRDNKHGSLCQRQCQRQAGHRAWQTVPWARPNSEKPVDTPRDARLLAGSWPLAWVCVAAGAGAGGLCTQAMLSPL